MRKNPIQPIYFDHNGVARFKSNKIVEYLLLRAKEVGVDLNHLACLDFSQDDEEQFAQLHGYSLDGWSELSYISEGTFVRAFKQKEKDLHNLILSNDSLAEAYAKAALTDWPEDAPYMAMLKQAILDVATKAVKLALENKDR